MTLILTVIFVMDMFLWFLSCMPFPATAPYGWASNILAFIAVLILGLIIFGHL